MNEAERPLPRRAFEVPVRGIKAEGIDLSAVAVGDFVYLKNEPNNPVDIHAVVVLSQDHHKLGYLPKDVACRMDPAEWDAVVCGVLEFEGKSSGLRLQVRPHVAQEPYGS